MLVETEKKYYTPEEYLKLEETAEYKNEYHNGEIIPMVGGTTNHNKICLNFCRQFPLTINNQDYDIYMEGVRLWLSEHNFYTYPDVMVIKGEPIYHGKGTSNIINPQVIIEVLSKSTKGYDRGDKFQYYRSLPTFQEYILIEQYSYSVDQYVKKSENEWSLNFYTGENAILKFASVEWEISLQDLYKRVNFELLDQEES
ncbi:Uma2 family endonuclease [Crocosphaera sp. XPORK-15E]|uniref:Uma2 family endonuclease n=1 Tax=Crocosphaera sp. XPORK-15E TaxID=3110247 RepID=UPI002B21FAC1|nr:Uma2 family endonuclease [Crocosphaera sp. XPORK-15E]MEA5534678.1 Uma2 family endonuclease [Crocosphaera sp. XPORK-15E]